MGVRERSGILRQWRYRERVICKAWKFLKLSAELLLCNRFCVPAQPDTDPCTYRFSEPEKEDTHMKKLSVMTMLTAAALSAALMTGTAFAAEVTDPSGNAITLPENVEKIVTMSPSSTQFVIDLGLGDKIVACDTYSIVDYADGLSEDVAAFDMMTPDNEQLVALSPDLILTTGMSYAGGEDVYSAVKEAGICVADIPSESSIQEIQDNLLFIGTAVGAAEEAQAIVDDMKETIAQIEEIGAAIPEEEKKTVLYEISTPSADYPTLYTCGANTYIDEMISLVGAVSVTGDQDADWIAVSEEEAIAMNPDVIFTTDTYTPDVVATLLGLSGWENVTAVVDEAVYELDANAINRPNQHIVSAMVEMGQILYPDAFAEVEDPFTAAE